MVDKRKHRILFIVDDLTGLSEFSYSLDEYSDHWETAFAASAQEALNILSRKPFDALVMNIKKSGIDGIQLLDAVNREMPGVIRFVLSGSLNDAQMLSATRLVHQMIPKSCDTEKIYNIVERSCRMRDMLTNPQLLRIITGIKVLPAVPTLYNRLVNELDSDQSSSQAIGNIIGQDTAMTSKILQLVNSAFFGLSENVNSPQRAVTILGLNTIKALVLGVQIFSEYLEYKRFPVSLETIWKHSILVSSLSDSIAKTLNFNSQEREDARVSGILHDVGLLMLFKLPDYLPEISFKKNCLISVESEYKAMGTSHAEMGAYLLGIWGLPTPIVEAVAYHHKPQGHISNKASVITTIYIANGLWDMCVYGKDNHYANHLDLDYVERVGCSGHLDDWASTARDLLDRIK